MSSPGRRAALTGPQTDRNEAFLVEQARRLPVDEFRKVMRRWGLAVDGATAEREHTEAVLRESLVLARRRDGLALSGFLTHEHGEVLATALRSVGGVPSRDDERTLEQRQAAALTDVARLVLDRGLSGQGAQVRPHLSVLVPFGTLAALDEGARDRGVGAGDRGPGRDGASLRPPAELESGEPLPASVLARIACDSEITRVVFGPTGQVLDVGQTERTYSKELRRAVIARDRHCSYPTCTAPPALCEVHHIRWFCRGGVTSVENGILLCWYHHELVHGQDLRIARVDHGFTFERPDGTPVGALGRGDPSLTPGARTGGSPAPPSRPPAVTLPGGAPPATAAHAVAREHVTDASARREGRAHASASPCSGARAGDADGCRGPRPCATGRPGGPTATGPTTGHDVPVLSGRLVSGRLGFSTLITSPSQSRGESR